MLLKNKILLYLIISVLIGIIYILPQALGHDYPNLIDITETIVFKDKISLTNTLRESLQDPTRMRIVYMVHRYLLSKSFGFSNHWLFLSHGLLLGLSLFMVYLSLSIKSIKTYFLVVLLILFSPITIDTYWRLGVAENLLSFLLIVCLFFYDKRSIFFYPLVILLLFAKETAIFFICGFIMFSITRKQQFNSVFFIVSLILFSLLLIPRLAQAQNELNYTSLLIINPPTNLQILFSYIKEFPLVFITLFLADYLYVKNHNDKFTLLFILANISILPLVVFNNVQAYYLFPTLCISSLFLVNNIAKAKVKKTIVFVSVLFILIYGSKQFIKMAEYWYRDYEGDNALIKFVLNNRTEKINISKKERIEYRNSVRYLLGSSYTSEDNARFIISRNQDDRQSKWSILDREK